MICTDDANIDMSVLATGYYLHGVLLAEYLLYLVCIYPGNI